MKEPRLADAFRARALFAGAAAGAVAIAGLIVEDHDAHRIYNGLTTGWGLTAVIISGVAGIISLGLTWTRRYGAARAGAALAVAALLSGWAAAQRPFVLPGLTLSAAAAADSTMIAIIISIALGAVILFPSLALLFRLSLAGRFDPAAIRRQAPAAGPDAPRPAWSARVAIAGLLIGIVLLTIADAGVAHIFGIVAFVVAAFAGFTAIGPDELARTDVPLETSPARHRPH
jgi:cytochrome d ubiquinol oxidase subunit II